MKRYVIANQDFDTRATILRLQIQPEWEAHVRGNHEAMKQSVRESIVAQYGAADLSRKLVDFEELGPLPMSILSYHNEYSRQVRDAFVQGAYYPAATGACALGERILNHLVFDMRGDFSGSDGYKRVYRKDSIASWELATEVLQEWGVLRAEVAGAFERLRKLRVEIVHFRSELATQTRERALNAAQTVFEIITDQFGAFGVLPWFIPGARGNAYLRKDSEMLPFVRRFYIPAAVLVGPKFQFDWQGDRLVVVDNHEYPAREVSDEEFVALLTEAGR